MAASSEWEEQIAAAVGELCKVLGGCRENGVSQLVLKCYPVFVWISYCVSLRRAWFKQGGVVLAEWKSSLETFVKRSVIADGATWCSSTFCGQRAEVGTQVKIIWKT